MAVTQGLWNIGSVNVPDLGISEGGGGVLGQVVRTLIPSITQAPSNSLQYNSDKLIEQPKSTGYSGDWGSSQPVPTSTPKITTPTNNPTPSGSSDSELMQLMKIGAQGQLNPSQKSRLAELLGGQQSGFSVPQGPSDQEINDLYNPLYGNLSQQEQQLGVNKASDLSMLDTSAQAASGTLQKQRGLYEQQFTANKEDVQGQSRSAYEEAIRARNSLRQQANSRFGGTSSAGQAVGELADAEFYRNQGSVQKSTMETLNNLVLERSKAAMYYDDENNRIERELNQQKESIRRQFTDALTQINSQKAMLDSEKTARKLAVREQFDAQLSQIQNQVASAKLGLETWITQFNMTNKANLETAAQDYSKTVTKGLFSDVTDNLNKYSVAPTSNAGKQTSMNYNPFFNKSDEDQFFT